MTWLRHHHEDARNSAERKAMSSAPVHFRYSGLLPAWQSRGRFSWIAGLAHSPGGPPMKEATRRQRGLT
jgi:hypothetical protein